METETVDILKVMDSRERTIWNGELHGVSWEIQRFAHYRENSGRKYAWTFYLSLDLGRFPVEANPDAWWLTPRYDDKGREHYDYYGTIMNDIDWHGGMTWYSKESSPDSKARYIKVGCDYGHYGDLEDSDYSLDWIKQDVLAAIQSFRRLVPGYKVRCRWDGELHDPKDVEFLPNGGFKCPDYAIKAEASRIEYEKNQSPKEKS